MPAPGDQYRDNKATVNPFEDAPIRVNEYTATEIATLQSRLERQLGPEYISTRPGAGGGKVHYLAAEKVINLANEVFGFNGWSSAIQNVQVDFVDEAANSGKISLGLSVISRVTLKDGTYHEDIGYGHIENCKGKAAAFEKAKKEAATDALKRALRNFGNVLGNCLYDKDYLQRITKIKVAPSRWDAENLHRHPDFAPIKRESIADAEAARANRPTRNASAQSAGSNTTTEYGEDEFGGNLFDEVDFSHPDEIHLDGSSTDVTMETPEQARAKGQISRQQMNRVNSMPTLNAPNAPRGPVQPQQVYPPNRPPTRRPEQGSMMPPPGGNSTSNGVHPQHPIQAQQNGNVMKKLTPPQAESPQVAQQNGQPPETPNPPTVGFVAGRFAGSSTIEPFNPYKESPSIPRTKGVNHAKSEPIVRAAIGTAAPALPAHTAQSGVSNAKPNFINPAADANRRIGMPNGGMSPMGNRGAYKPPSAIKRPAPVEAPRPPLSDMSNMSNMQQVDGANDAKKARVDAPGEQNQPNVTAQQ